MGHNGSKIQGKTFLNKVLDTQFSIAILFQINLFYLQIIRISFTHLILSTESTESCNQTSDRLLIVDEDRKNCLGNNIREFVSQSNNITVILVTNEFGDAPGFHLQYKTGN